MESKDLIRIPTSILDELKKHLEEFILDDKKPAGYDEALRYVALQRATTSQLAKLNSFSNHFESSSPEHLEKHKILDKMVTFAKNWVAQDKRKKELSNRVRNNSDHPTGATTKNQTGRKVDRLTKPSMASLKPAEVNEEEVQIYCARIIEIINKI
jgi:predicted RecB family endonuclease